MTRSRLIVLLSAAIALAAPAVADPMTEAKRLFETFVARTNGFDPSVADLYADEARIENTRKYPDGTSKTALVPAARYKQMLRDSMPRARERRDTSDFLAVDYEPIDGKVRISTTRLSRLSGEGTPLTLVVGPGPDGKWSILEEHSESRPERKE